MHKVAIALLLLSAPAVQAQNVNAYSDVTILPGHMTASGQYLAGVQITMAQGWKTYWRQPGEGGLPPVFDWSGSSNVTSATVEWPVPEVFDTYGLRSLGYHDSVVFPILFDMSDPQADARLRLSLDYGLCSDICIPAHSEASALLPAGQVHNAQELARARRDTTRQASGLVADCAVVPAADAWRLDATVRADHPLERDLVAVFETADPNLWIGTPDAVEQGDGLLFSAPMEWFGDGAFAMSREDMRITLVSSGRSAVELTGC